MKKKIILWVIAAVVLITVFLAIISGTKQEKEISSGAKLVFRRMNAMKETEDTEIAVMQTKAENEIFRESKEDTIGY